jgi:hypothetical protein
LSLTTATTTGHVGPGFGLVHRVGAAPGAAPAKQHKGSSIARLWFGSDGSRSGDLNVVWTVVFGTGGPAIPGLQHTQSSILLRGSGGDKDNSGGSTAGRAVGVALVCAVCVCV